MRRRREPDEAPGTPAPGRRVRAVTTAVGVLLVAAGIAVAGGVAWQTWAASPLAAGEQEHAAADQTRRWAAEAPAHDDGRATPVPAAGREPQATATVAVIVVPRFGRSWQRVVRQGVDEATVLNSATAGVGHYPGTALPGGIGNFAIAAHDTGYGDAFLHLGDLRLGDPIFVRTPAGWYTYRFRNLQWVQPDEVGVIAPVPDAPRTGATQRLITLTTCDPPYHAQEREIAYGVLEAFDAGTTPPPGA